MSDVLETGGEIHFTDDRDCHVPDRIEFLDGGYVKAIYKRQYAVKVFPPTAIEGIYTHTSDEEENAEWW